MMPSYTRQQLKELAYDFMLANSVHKHTEIKWWQKHEVAHYCSIESDDKRMFYDVIDELFEEGLLVRKGWGKMDGPYLWKAATPVEIVQWKKKNLKS